MALTYWDNDVGFDVVLGTLSSKSLGESDETHYRTISSDPKRIR